MFESLRTASKSTTCRSVGRYFFVAWGSERSNDAGADAGADAGGKAGNDANAVLVSSHPSLL